MAWLLLIGLFALHSGLRATGQQLPSEVGTTVNGFQDDFNGTMLNTNWVVAGSSVFSVSGGLLHVMPATGDPNHLLFELPGYNNTTQEVLARVRVLSYGSGDLVRGGIGVGVDPSSTQGINYLFRENTSDGQSTLHMALLDDIVAWGPVQNFVWQLNTWYWIRLRQEPNAASQGGANDVFAKIWLADGSQPEPAAWQLSWDYTPTSPLRTGFAGITASSGSPFQFDVDYFLVKASGLPSIVVAPDAFVQSPAAITSQPQSQTTTELQSVSFTVVATGNPAPSFQWYRGGNPIAGATDSTYTIASATLSDNGAQFEAVVQNIVSNTTYSITSSVASLTVIADTNPPVLLGARCLGLSQVFAMFSKPITAATATNISNFLISGTNSNVTITSATLDGSQSNIVLAVLGLSNANSYTLTVSNLAAQTASGTLISPGSQATFFASSFTPVAIGTPVPAGGLFSVPGGIGVSATGADIGGATDQFQFAYQQMTGDFDLSVDVSSLALSDGFAKAGLMARETIAPSSRFAAALATPAMSGCFFEWRDPAGSVANTAGRFPANFPYTWLRVKRAGNTFTGFAGYDGQSWSALGSASITLPASVYVGLAVSSHNTNQATAAQFISPAQPVTNASALVAANPHEPIGVCSRITPIVISEIMYKPASRADGRNLEFIEIYNTDPWFHDLSNYKLTGSVSFSFPQGTVIPGGGYLVIAAAPADLDAVYGITNIIGSYSGTLKKTGTIQLLDEIGAVLLTVPYSNLYPWPVAADGTGHSIVLAAPTYGEGDPRAWDISDVVGGSPGQGEAFRPSPLRSIVINEILAHTEDPIPQYVELYNRSGQQVDLSGCILTDNFSSNKFTIPPGTLIQGGGFATFLQDQLGFTLDPAGGTVFLIKPDGTRALDAVQFQPEPDGVSFGRYPDGASEFYALGSRTPSGHNNTIAINDIVINELMYAPITGNDDDQYIELYNKGTNSVSLSGWQFVSGISFVFPPNVSLAPAGYLVIARNQTNLFAKYPNLNPANTLGNFGGKLSHKGERVALGRPMALVQNGGSGPVTNTVYVVEDEVTFGAGGNWGQWAHAGGSSLELINPNSNHRLAYNWADSDETAKSAWTNIEFTGVLDNGANFNGSPINLVQLGLLDVGECLVDNIEVRPGGPAGVNILTNGDFEAGNGSWTAQGDHLRSSLETSSGLGGYQSSQSFHLRSSDGMWTLADYLQSPLSQTALAAGQTATLRLKARWLHGWPEVLMRLRGNWLEVSDRMPIPPNLGSPGLPNSRYRADPPAAIYAVKHSPPIPAASQPVVVSARFDGTTPFRANLLYRIDTGVNANPVYTSVPMLDNATGGDSLAGDGLYSATIPAQPAGTVVAFRIQAVNLSGPASIFPQDLTNNAGLPRECVIAFGDPVPTGSFSQHHVFITQNWAQRWAQWGGVSHEYYHGTWVDGGGRIVYNWMGRYAGSPYHQYLGSPVSTIGGMHWLMPEDDQVFGTATFNKEHVPGNGPLDDNTIQREQASFWMARQLGLPVLNRRYYFYYVNGTRHGPLMEDTQVPGAEMLKEYWPNDNNGILYKNNAWFEGDVALQPSGYMNVNNMSFCVLGKFTTTINGVPNQYKLARYRWMWWIRQFADSASDFSQLYALIDAANTPITSPAYYANMESQVDTEEWLRLSAIEHATGDLDSLFTLVHWNMYSYKPTMGKWTALKWDWNITLGAGTSPGWGPDGSQLFTFSTTSPGQYGGYDPLMTAFHSYPPYRRAYLRAFEDVANLAMNNARINPMLDAKYAAFAANGLTSGSYNIKDPAAAGGLESWIGTMHNSLLTTLASQGVSSVAFVINSTVVSNDVALIAGTAPLQVKTIWFNGTEWPLTWTSVTNWTATVPLKPGTNSLRVAGIDLRGQPVPGATNNIVAFNPIAPVSPAGRVVLNEIMYNPAVPGADYVELYNNSSNIAFDLSGWQLNGLGYNFPPGSLINPNNYLVLASNPSAFSGAYGGKIPIFGILNTPLSSSGQTLALTQSSPAGGPTSVVAEIQYRPGSPWPGSTGPGSSLQLIDPTQDNWRAGNWAMVFTIAPNPVPQWQYVTVTGSATQPTVLICMHGTPGDVYLDDLKLVAGSVPESGPNLIQNGDFESPLSGPWTLSPNMTNSVISTAVKHSGGASLHVMATSPGDTLAQAIWENTAAITTNGTYTLSYWYLPSTNGSQLLIRLSGSSPNSGQVYSLQNIQPPSANPLTYTPGAPNSVLASLPAFQPLWLNELQPDN
ncbi:MAG TPA: lamin tail domain-containing protein, partial [Verrucomicrobiae bacterium]|nr:lamin tail domain-containing protein [Verrucomicrobiae bacterium]